jgi:SsrA-binding protein
MQIQNKRARFDYQILEEVEAGLALTGAEVKTLKEGRGDISHAFVRIRDGEAWLIGANIPQYGHSSSQTYDPLRTRKVLLHKEEIISLGTKMSQANLTLVPVKVYNKGRLVKVRLALSKGKKQFEKKETTKRKDIQRQIERDLKDRS